MSSSNCYFLACIQVSQEAGKVVWYSHLFKNFKFVVIHTVKGFSVLNEAEVDVFLEFSCIFLWSNRCWQFVPLPFLNQVFISGSSWFTYCWSLAWRVLSITLLECEMSALVRQFEHSLALPFFGIGMKTDLFQSCGHCCFFQICWHIECSTFAVSSLRIWNSSAGMPKSKKQTEGNSHTHRYWIFFSFDPLCDLSSPVPLPTTGVGTPTPPPPCPLRWKLILNPWTSREFLHHHWFLP